MSVTIHLLEGEPIKPGAPMLSLEKSTILIGRGSDQDVRLTNDSVSRRHCVLERREGQWVIVDEGSGNGSIVNGQRVVGTGTIRHGDVLQVGEVMMRVGLDRPLKDDMNKGGKTSIPVIIRSITGILIGIVAILALVSAGMMFQYTRTLANLKATIPVEFPDNFTSNVFLDRRPQDPRFISFGLLPVMDNWNGPFGGLSATNPEPEWYTGDVWTALNKNRRMEPRLFEGLDLDLKGGEQVVCSGYFFVRARFYARDLNAPQGQLDFEIEGWSGFGERYGTSDLPVLRHLELPHFVKSYQVFPDAIVEGRHPVFENVEEAEFSWQSQVYDLMPGDPLYPPLSERIVTKLVSEDQRPIAGKRYLFKGKCFSFYHDGCRYNVVVRGTAHTIDRFEGGLDNLAQTFFETVQIENKGETVTLNTDEMEEEIRLNRAMLTAMARKPNVLDAVRYENLLDVRNLLLDCQTFAEPLKGEEELRRLYFKVRNKTQESLETAMHIAAEGRDQSTLPARGEKELLRMIDFLGNYPPPTLSRREPGYPEWAWFYTDAIQTSPYTQMIRKIETP